MCERHLVGPDVKAIVQRAWVAVVSAEDKAWLEAHLLPAIEAAVSGAARQVMRVTLEVKASSVLET